MKYENDMMCWLYEIVKKKEMRKITNKMSISLNEK